VERHEHFEEVLASASLGEATGAELADLQEHLRECPDCRAAYADFMQVSAVRMVREANGQQEMTGAEAIGYINSAQFREKVLRKAEAEGILARRTEVARLPEPVIRPFPQRRSWTLALVAAAMVFVTFGSVALYRARLYPSTSHMTVKAVDSPATSPDVVSGDNTREKLVSHLESENRRLTTEIVSLKASLAKETSTAEESKRRAATSEEDRSALAAAAKERDRTIADFEHQLRDAQAELAGVRAELEKTRTSNAGMVAADQTMIRDLSDQLAEKTSALDREREMLSANRDIRDLMSARNLHIADVFDTDTKGRTRTAFGRVFFTEGKSLLIYAYDLNDSRVQEAGYHYRVWGKKEAPGQRAMNLGIFYSDDKAQKRWVFKCEDPKILSEIDSVFVTLEPPGKNLAQPHGEKFLYAYLRNQPNHP
jgi:hypothetical protein